MDTGGAAKALEPASTEAPMNRRRSIKSISTSVSLRRYGDGVGFSKPRAFIFRTGRYWPRLISSGTVTMASSSLSDLLSRRAGTTNPSSP